MIIVNKYLVPKGFAGITIYPFVFLREEKYLQNKKMINHENIHLKQQLELLIIPFFIWYGIEYLLHLRRLKRTSLAYRAISFEKEAYQNDDNLYYLKTRKLYSFLKYGKQ